MVRLFIWCDVHRTALIHRLRGERGQATAEYALVMIAAAAIAVALITWATTTGTLRTFFDAVMRRVRSYV